jgi:hypothetical protein
VAKSAVSWPDLLEIYLHSRWDDATKGEINIENESILETLALIETSEKAYDAADIAPVAAPGDIAIGKVVRARIGYPQLRLGVLAENWDGLLATPKNRVKEPPSYFVKADRAHSGMAPATEPVTRYRAILHFVELLGRAALFTDADHGKLVYFGEGRVEVPVRYEASDFRKVDADHVSALSTALEGDVHREQRLGILGEAITALVAGQSEAGRFLYLLQNVDELTKRVIEGYRLFASSFSYSKIRGEVEKAQAEYVGRIHKTFADIQGQLLGLPVSAIVVATQLKTATACGQEAIANVAILCGAWLFVALLVASCGNQWLTLNSIAGEIRDQRNKLNSEFSEIRYLFVNSFDAIETRIGWHRFVLVVISIVALSGAWFTWQAYRLATAVDAWKCLSTVT